MTFKICTKISSGKNGPISRDLPPPPPFYTEKKVFSICNYNNMVK